LETWGVLGASRTGGEPAVGHGFMVAGQSDRDVPIPGALGVSLIAGIVTLDGATGRVENSSFGKDGDAK